MVDLDLCIAARRDTRHFLSDPVPDEVLIRALQAAHKAPSVGLSEPMGRDARARIASEDNFNGL
jgi:nitroreductase